MPNKNHSITISTFQPICLLGDLAADFGFNSINITAGDPVLLTISKLKPGASLLHFTQDDIHVELTQLTPIISKDVSQTMRQLINLTHNLLLQLQLPFGINLKITINQILNSEKLLSVYIVGLWKALAQIQDTKMTNTELLTSCLAYAQQVGYQLDWHNAAAAIYGGLNYCNFAAQTVQTFSVKNLKLYTVAVKKDLSAKLHHDIYNHIKQKPERYQGNLIQINRLVDLGATALAKQDITKLGEYCNRTQKLLTDFGLITDEAHHLCVQANLDGAMGAKYSQELKSVLIICDQKAVEVRAKLMRQNLTVAEIDII